MPRPQFSIRTLLWLTLVVAAFFAGTVSQKPKLKAEITDLVERALREAAVKSGQQDVTALQHSIERQPLAYGGVDFKLPP